MARSRLPRFADPQSTERALQLLSSGDWVRASVGTSCAWLLRQSHQDKAVQIAQSLLAGVEGTALEPLSRVDRGYLTLTLAEAAYLSSRVDEAKDLCATAFTHFRAAEHAPGQSDALFVEASFAGEASGGDIRTSLMARSLDLAHTASDEERTNTSWLALQIFGLLGSKHGNMGVLAEVTKLASSEHPGTQALANCFLMYSELAAGNLASAARYGIQAQACAMDAGYLSRAIADGSNVGVIFFDMEDLDGTLAQVQPILELARQAAWPSSISAASRILAVTLLKLGRHEGALLMAREAVSASATVPNSRNHLNCLHAAADCALEFGDFESAERWYHQVQESAVGAEGRELRRYASVGLGKVYARTSRLEEAVEMAEQAIEWSVSESDPSCEVESLRLLAGLVGRTGKKVEIRGEVATPVSLLQQAVDVAEHANQGSVSYTVLQELAAALEAEGRHFEAAQVLKRSIRQLEAQRAGAADRRGSALEIRYKTELALADAQAQRAAAEMQAAKSLELEALNRQLRSAMAELESTQALLVKRNEELTAAHARISELSIKDPLTGLHNRRFFSEVIESAVSEARRAYRPSAFAELEANQQSQGRDLLFFMLDMDHFKGVNDQYGHAAGDAVLVQLKDRLRSVTRGQDYLIRWGGEEFLIAFRGVSREDGPLLADRLLYAVSSAAFELPRGVSLHKTISIGYAAFPQDVLKPQEGTWEAAVELADARLYEAKRAGRNRAVGDLQSTCDGDAAKQRTLLG